MDTLKNLSPERAMKRIANFGHICGKRGQIRRNRREVFVFFRLRGLRGGLRTRLDV
jgi:hypothetical protein